MGGLAAFSLLGVGGLLALPIFVLPVILLGAPARRGLVNTAILGAIGFVAFAAFGAVVLAYDAPLRWAGRAAQRVRNWVLRKRPPLTGLDETLLAQRNAIRAVLGRQWWQALLLSAGRLGFDYLCLLAALLATGSRPRPSLILVAYAAAGIIGLIPITPGGLGVVEASLTGLLVLAEVNSSQAVLATLAYRLASYWAPLLAGPVAYGLFRIRYRSRPSPRAPGARRHLSRRRGSWRRSWRGVTVPAEPLPGAAIGLGGCDAGHAVGPQPSRAERAGGQLADRNGPEAEGGALGPRPDPVQRGGVRVGAGEAGQGLLVGPGRQGPERALERLSAQRDAQDPGERRAWRHRRIAYIRKAGARRASSSSNIELITMASGPAPGCSIRVQGISMTAPFIG